MLKLLNEFLVPYSSKIVKIRVPDSEFWMPGVISAWITSFGVEITQNCLISRYRNVKKHLP